MLGYAVSHALACCKDDEIKRKNRLSPSKLVLSQDDLRGICLPVTRSRDRLYKGGVRDPYLFSLVLAGHPEDVVYLKITKYTA